MPEGADDTGDVNISYRLKVELRREQREGRDKEPYARALEHVLNVFSEHDRDDALVLVEDEMLDLEAREDVGRAEVEALRRVLTLAEPRRHGSRELFAYYLRKMEDAGRGDEPFACALRRALRSRRRASIRELFKWKDEHRPRDSAEK